MKGKDRSDQKRVPDPSDPLENKGKIISRERLMEKLWESDSFVDENTLSVNVNRLPEKAGEGRPDRFYFYEGRHGISHRIRRAV